jgi:phage FluMu gp28-like protein
MLFKFLPFQQEYILSNPKILVVEKARQIGFTYTSGYKVIRKIMNNPTPEEHYWLSRDENLAKEFVTNCLDWIQLFNIAAECEAISIKDVKTTKIKFPNGSQLFILSSSVDACVGRSGHFYLDEFAIHKDQEQLWNIILPCSTWGFTLTVISTHRSKTTFFYKLCNLVKSGNMPNSKIMTVNIEQALDAGLAEAISTKLITKGMPSVSAKQVLEMKKAEASSEEMFMQEYMCIPADSESGCAVNEESLAKCLKPKDDLFQPPRVGGKYYAGVDIGRHRDLTVVWIIEDVSKDKTPCLETREVFTMSNKEFSFQEKEIFRVLNKWKPRHTHVDGTNTGAMLGESIEKKYGLKRAKAVRISAVTRPKFIGDAVGVVQREFVGIPDDPETWEDFQSVERYINKHGQVDYWIPSRGDKGHGDRFMAFTLAIQSYIESGALGSYYLREAKVVQESHDIVKREERKELRKTFRRKKKFGGF